MAPATAGTADNRAHIAQMLPRGWQQPEEDQEFRKKEEKLQENSAVNDKLESSAQWTIVQHLELCFPHCVQHLDTPPLSRAA